MMARMNSKTLLFCHMDLGWGDNDTPCRNEVFNDPKSIMIHMIENHGWNRLPELVRRDIENNKPHPKTKEIMTEVSYLLFIRDNPEEWFFDNQLIWSEFRNSHFKKTVEVNRS